MSYKVFCMYCGIGASDIRSLTGTQCHQHPAGRRMGWHVPYQGVEKSSYECMYCGIRADSIRSLTGTKCAQHPEGRRAGWHIPSIS